MVNSNADHECFVRDSRQAVGHFDWPARRGCSFSAEPLMALMTLWSQFAAGSARPLSTTRPD
jgi:hypothetical protein